MPIYSLVVPLVLDALHYPRRPWASIPEMPVFDRFLLFPILAMDTERRVERDLFKTDHHDAIREHKLLYSISNSLPGAIL